MRIIIAGKIEKELTLALVNELLPGGLIRKISGSDRLSDSGYADFIGYAVEHGGERLGLPGYGDATVRDFAEGIRVFLSPSGYLMKTLESRMRPFLHPDRIEGMADANVRDRKLGERRKFFEQRLKRGFMKSIEGRFRELFGNSPVTGPKFGAVVEDRLGDIAVSLNDLYGKPGGTGAEFKRAVGDFENGRTGILEFSSRLSRICDGMKSEGVMSDSELALARERAWRELKSNHAVSVPGGGGEFTTYVVNKDDQKLLSAVAARPVTDWCVAQRGLSGQNFFSNYAAPYYMICRGEKPVALLNVDSRQFKDEDDEPIEKDRKSHARLVDYGRRLAVSVMGLKDLERDEDSWDSSSDFDVFGDLERDLKIKSAVVEDVRETVSEERARELTGGLKGDRRRNALRDLRLSPEAVDGLLGDGDPELNGLLASTQRLDADQLKRLISEQRRLDMDSRSFYRSVFRQDACSDDLIRWALEAVGGRELILSVMFKGSEVSGCSEDTVRAAARMALGGGFVPAPAGAFRPEAISESLKALDGNGVNRVFRSLGDDELSKALDCEEVFVNCLEKGDGSVARKISMELDVLNGRKSIRRGRIIDLMLDRGDAESVANMVMTLALDEDQQIRAVEMGDDEVTESVMKYQGVGDRLLGMMVDRVSPELLGKTSMTRRGGGKGDFVRHDPSLVDRMIDRCVGGHAESVIRSQELSGHAVELVADDGSLREMTALAESHRISGSELDRLVERAAESGCRELAKALVGRQKVTGEQARRLFGTLGRDEVMYELLGNELVDLDLVWDYVNGKRDLDNSFVERLLSRKRIDFRRILPLVRRIASDGGSDQRISFRMIRDAHDDDELMLEIMTGRLGGSFSRTIAKYGGLGELTKELIMESESLPAILDMLSNNSVSEQELNEVIERVLETKGTNSNMMNKIAKIPGLSDKTVERIRKEGGIGGCIGLMEAGYMDCNLSVEEAGRLMERMSELGLSRLAESGRVGDGFYEYVSEHGGKRENDFVRALAKNPKITLRQLGMLRKSELMDDYGYGRIAMNSDDISVVREVWRVRHESYVLSNLLANKNMDAGEVKSMIKPLSAFSRSVALDYFGRFGMSSAIERSKYLFDVLKKHGKDIPTEDLARYADPKYGEDISDKAAEMYRNRTGMDVPAAKVARVVRRLAMRVALRRSPSGRR